MPAFVAHGISANKKRQNRKVLAFCFAGEALCWWHPASADNAVAAVFLNAHNGWVTPLQRSTTMALCGFLLCLPILFPVSATSPTFKIPQSVLVIIHTAELQVLLLRRADSPSDQPYWQPVTGSKDADSETWVETAIREVREETGIDANQPGCVLRDWNLENIYLIYPQWLYRYAPGVRMNTEHVLSLQVPSYAQITLSPREHTAFAWHDWREAAERCYSISNSEAILWLPRFTAP